MPQEPPSAALFRAPAEHYDRFMGRYTPALAAALADAAGIRPGMRVLDVGCGPGGLTRELASRVGPGNVAGIDPAPQFAAACRDRTPGADIRTGVAEQLPWPDSHFDAVLSCLVIGFMRDPDLGVREMARVTRPGGVIAVCMWDTADGGMTMLEIFWTAARQIQATASGEQLMAGASRTAISLFRPAPGTPAAWSRRPPTTGLRTATVADRHDTASGSAPAGGHPPPEGAAIDRTTALSWVRPGWTGHCGVYRRSAC